MSQALGTEWLNRGWRTLGMTHRSRRMAVLLAGIVILSLADLIVTLTHLKTIGMMEANPIAAWLVKTTQSPWVLSLYKAATVGICVALLYRLRRHLEGEIAAWVAVGILAAMSFMWHSYSNEYEGPATVSLAQTYNEDQWLFLR